MKGKAAAGESKAMAAHSTSTMRAWCILVDHDSKLSFGDQPFHVEVPLEIYVALLKKNIIEEAKINVPTYRLEVWDGNALKKRDGEEIPQGELKKRLHDFDFSIETRLLATSKVRLSEGDIVIARVPQNAGKSCTSTAIRTS